ncbi:MAG: SLC13 family permease [Proteobacteria bacterium]|nr:SLC13 family permease [Pseudomonadota bacterium]MCP4920516.1 SLC13 family permease [Pseudomonadota bacterium]
MKWPQRVGLFLGPALTLAIVLAPTPEGLTVPGQRGLAVLALCVVWWLSTPVALPVTALVGLALLPLLGVLEPYAAFSLFGNQAVFFVVGVFLVASAMLRTGLSKRLALAAMRRMAGSEDMLAGSVLLLSWGLCAVVVSHAVAALMLPIVLGLIQALDLGPRSRLARRLLLSMAWGTIIGSNLTLFSSARASLALSTYTTWASETGSLHSLGFLEFSSATLLICLLLLPIAFVWLRISFPNEGVPLAPAVERLNDDVAQLGSISAAEVRTIGVLVLFVPALVIWGPEYGLGTIALVGSAALFVLKVLEWKEAERYVNWGIVLLYGGAIAIGAGLDQSGAMKWVVTSVLPTGSVPVFIALLVIGGLAMLMTEFVSNAAVIALALPAVLAISPALGLDGRLVTVLMSVACGLAFSMPTSTPAMAMAFGTGYLRLRRVVAVGSVLSLAALCILAAVAWKIWPLLGLGVSS